MAITTSGRILEFHEKLEDWIQYSVRMEHFSLLTTSMMLIKRERFSSLSSDQLKEYKLLRSLVAPERLEEKSYTDLVEAMKKYHNLKLSETVQQHKVFCQFRQQSESISTFMSELRALVKFCNFVISLDIMLHD